jgi:hypothetical protein
MKAIRIAIALAAFVALSGPGIVNAAGSCGPVPPTPPPQPGCVRMRPECQCDSRGQQCHYVFICEKK